MTHPFGTQRAPEIYQGAALLVVNKGSSSLYRSRSKYKINMIFKAALEEKRMKYNGKSIIKQSASVDLSIDKLADKKDKYSHYDFSMPHLVLYEIYGAHLAHHLDAPLSDLTQSISQISIIALLGTFCRQQCRSAVSVPD